MIWDKANQGRQAQGADTHLRMFVARNYYEVPNRQEVRFLDIGSGRHAPNTVYLESKDFTVTAIDFSHAALAHIHADICALDVFAAESFDCVFDINTLCHVEQPPMKKIRSWLKPGGKFFSIAPRFDTSLGHLEGKGFCRLATMAELFRLYGCFEQLSISPAYYEHDGEAITSWICEGAV